MVKIAVFDSGFGSLSIILAIRKIMKADLIYFADQKNFPYGTKNKKELHGIISKTILMLQEKFNPDLIIVGSNTPSLLLSKIFSKKLISVLPPVKQASKITKTGAIAILTTQSVAKSRELSEFIKENKIKKGKIIKINSSELVNLVESGRIFYHKEYCIKKIRQVLRRKFLANNIDVATLSSTHLPFLIEFLQAEFPDMKFLDPADTIAKKVSRLVKSGQRQRLEIFTSGKPKLFQKNLKNLGICNKVKVVTIS